MWLNNKEVETMQRVIMVHIMSLDISFLSLYEAMNFDEKVGNASTLYISYI